MFRDRSNFISVVIQSHRVRRRPAPLRVYVGNRPLRQAPFPANGNHHLQLRQPIPMRSIANVRANVIMVVPRDLSPRRSTRVIPLVTNRVSASDGVRQDNPMPSVEARSVMVITRLFLVCRVTLFVLNRSNNFHRSNVSHLSSTLTRAVFPREFILLVVFIVSISANMIRNIQPCPTIHGLPYVIGLSVILYVIVHLVVVVVCVPVFVVVLSHLIVSSILPVLLGTCSIPNSSTLLPTRRVYRPRKILSIRPSRCHGNQLKICKNIPCVSIYISM